MIKYIMSEPLTKPPAYRRTELNELNGNTIRFNENGDIIINNNNVTQQIRTLEEIISNLTKKSIEDFIIL